MAVVMHILPNYQEEKKKKVQFTINFYHFFIILISCKIVIDIILFSYKSLFIHFFILHQPQYVTSTVVKAILIITYFSYKHKEE